METDAAILDLNLRLGLISLDLEAEHVHSGHGAVTTTTKHAEKLGVRHDTPCAGKSRAIATLDKPHDEVRRAEHTMANCEPEEVWHAKEMYKAALRRAASADGGAPPPSPPPSPPSSPARGPTPLHTDIVHSGHSFRYCCLGALFSNWGTFEGFPPEGRPPPPSPPPSPPHALEERLELLAVAEDAVARHYVFPSEPDNFATDLLPHLVRLVISFGTRPMTANTRAVFAVLVRSDDKNDSPSDLFVYSLMRVPKASFMKWKTSIDTLRADGGYGATSALLSLSEGPGASAPPSPPHSDGDDDQYDDLTDLRSYAIPDTLLRELGIEISPSNRMYCDDAFEFVANELGPLTAFDAHDGPPRLDLAECMATLDIGSASSPPRQTPSRRRAEAPPTPRKAVTPHPKRAGRTPPEPALGARRHQIARRRTREVGRAIWLAARTFRRPLDGPTRHTPTPSSAGAGCSTDPLAPEVDPYGLEVIQYSTRVRAASTPSDDPWDGLTVPCATITDSTGDTGLAYAGKGWLKRYDLIGIFLADTMVTMGQLTTWLRANPLYGEYAWSMCGWALIDSKGRSRVSKVNEGARPNTEIVEVDIGHPGDAPTYTVMALFALENIHPGATLYTDYGPDYFGVREARAYARPYDPRDEAQPTRWLNLGDSELEGVVLNTLSPSQLRDAKTWGGVISHGGVSGTRNDPNRRRGSRPAIARAAPPVDRAAPRSAPVETLSWPRGGPVGQLLTPHRDANLRAVHDQLLARAADVARDGPTSPGRATQAATADTNRPDHPAQRAAAHSHARLHWAGTGPPPPGMRTIHLHGGYNGFSISGAAPLRPGEPCALTVGRPAARKADVVAPTSHRGGQFWMHVTDAQCHNDGLTHACNVSIHTCDPMHAVCSHRRSSPNGTITARLIWPHGQMIADNPPKMTFDCVSCGCSNSATPLSDGDIVTFGETAAEGHPAAPRPPDQGAERVEWRFRLDVAQAERRTTIVLHGARGARIRAIWHRRVKAAAAAGEAMHLEATTTMAMHSMLHYGPWQHHRHPGARHPPTVSLCVELPDGRSGRVHISASLDHPLADILASDGLGIRLLLDGARLDARQTPRALGLHDDDDSPTLQLLFEQVGGGDGNHDDDGWALARANLARQLAQTRRACDWGGRRVTNLGHCADDRRYDHVEQCVMFDDAITQCCCHMVCYTTVAENGLLCDSCTDDISHTCACAGSMHAGPGAPWGCCTLEGEEGYVSSDESMTAADSEPPNEDTERDATEPDESMEREEAEPDGADEPRPTDDHAQQLLAQMLFDQRPRHAEYSPEPATLEPIQWRIDGVPILESFTFEKPPMGKVDPGAHAFAPTPGTPASAATDPSPPEVDPFGLEVIQYSSRARAASAATRPSSVSAAAPASGRRRGRRGRLAHMSRPQDEQAHAGDAGANDPAADAEWLAARLATIQMARMRVHTSYATAFDESDACTQTWDIEAMTRRLDRATGGDANAAVAAKLDELRYAYTTAAWEDLSRQARQAPGGATRRDCAVCGAHGTVPTPPRTLGGCLCGGGVCTECAADTCACPWDGSDPVPPVPDAASMLRNATPLGFLDLPDGDPYAPTVLCMGDASGAMAKACAKRFPTEICLIVDFRTRRAADAPHFGLYWCGDVRDVLWRQRWRVVFGHPDCADAALSNKTGKQARVDSGQLWWSLAFAVRLFCAPADVVLIEQPDSILAKAYREPDLVMQFLDHGVGYSKRWCIWRRGGEESFNPAVPSTPGATAHTHAAHRRRHCDRDEQSRIRSTTPPQMAAALCATINLNRGAFGHQPRYEDEVEVLADGYRLLTGQEPPDGYAEATARPPDPHARSAPRAPASANAPPASARHQLADIPLYGAGLARPKRRRTPDARAAPAQNARGAAHDTPNGSGAAPPTASCAPPVTPPPHQRAATPGRPAPYPPRTALTGARRRPTGDPPTHSAGGTRPTAPPGGARQPLDHRPTPCAGGTEATHPGARATPALQQTAGLATHTASPTARPRGTPHSSAAHSHARRAIT